MCLAIAEFARFHSSESVGLPIAQISCWRPIRDSAIVLANKPTAVYHFIGPSKPHLDRCHWQRSNPPELPFPENRQSIELLNEWKDNPPASYDIGSIFRPDLAANLLALYPKLLVSGTWSDELTVYDERLTSLDETFSSHLVLTRFLIRLGVNARRFKLRIKEGDDATLQLARS
jgi:hypothetical protein